MTVYTQSFTVEGRSDFPVDMLRYDNCYPDTSEDAVNMLSDEPEPRQVKLRRLVFNKTQMPTEGRWSSFGWKVVKTEPPRKV